MGIWLGPSMLPEARTAAVGPCGPEKIVAQRQFDALRGSDLHQPAGDVDRVAGRGDLLVMAFPTHARGDDHAEMGTDLEADPRRHCLRQTVQPTPGRAGEADAALQCRRRIAAIGAGQAEDDHRAVAHEAGDGPAAAARLLLDHLVETVEQIAHAVGPERFAQAGKTRNVDEDDCRLLPDRRAEKVRVPLQLSRQGRCLEPLQQFRASGEQSRLPAVEPDLAEPEQHDRRKGHRQRKRSTQPETLGKGDQIAGKPHSDDRRECNSAGGAALPGDQADQAHGKKDRNDPVRQPGLAVADGPVTGQQMRNGRCDDLHPRQHGVERRRKDVAAACHRDT